MKCSIKWLDQAENAAPEERATVADFTLELSGQNVTKHLIDNVLGESVTVALYGIASGLAHDWWSIFGARDRVFSFRKYRTGFLLPDLRFSFDGAIFDIAAYQVAYSDPDLRFWGGNSESLSRDDAEAFLSELIEEVLERLDDRGLDKTGAALRWQRVKRSRQSQEREFCEAAGGLGLDPYQIADETAKFIEGAENVFDDEALIEFVSGATEVDQERLLKWVDRMVGMKGFRYRLSDLRTIVDVAQKEDPKRLNEPAWAVGYRRARAIRKQLGIAQSDRLRSMFEIARKFGAPKNYNLAPKVDGINALRREAENGIDIHVRNHGESEEANVTNRFALARAIGDAACFPSPSTAPINRLHNAYRQAAGRAFAAEFLAPIDEIRSMRDDERDIYSIASELGVSSMTIEHQIENNERIEEACAIPG